MRIKADVAFPFLLFLRLWVEKRSDAQSDHGLFLESAADKGISVCSSLKEVRRTSHRARRRRGPCRATGSRRDWSGSSRPPPQTTPSGEKEQVRPERAVRTMPVQTLALTKPVAAPDSAKRKLAGG